MGWPGFSVLAEVVVLMAVGAAAIAAPAPQPNRDAPPPAPIQATTLNLADYMFGPPPHDRIDPGMRCWTRCP